MQIIDIITGPGDRPGPIVVKFLRFKDKVAVLERAKNLRGIYLFLNKDYPEAVRQKRKELIPAMKAARSRGDIAYTLPPRSLEGMREPSLCVHGFSTAAHTNTPID